VPVAGRLIARGAPTSAAVTFLLAAPAVNPVVLVATSVAFPHHPMIVLARFLASLLAAITVGLVWARAGKDEWLVDIGAPQEAASAFTRLFDTALHDALHAGGFLIVGAALAATLQTVVPRHLLDTVAGHGPMSIVAMGALAVVLAVCSEADAFIAASLSQFSFTARLVFMTVGPMVDIKLVAMQIGTFGRRFALRLAPLTLVSCVLSGTIVGWWLLPAGTGR
jgi:uncharacterized membrane protein YraQ (UPF0718 family)